MRRLYTALWVLMLVWFAGELARAGELTLTWQPPTSGPPVTGYKVYTGVSSGEYISEDVGMALTNTQSDLPNCVPSYLAVKAYNAGGESMYSVEVTSFPRPSITDVTSSQSGAHTILGNNFSDTPRVWVNSDGTFLEVDSADVQRLSCGEIRIPDVAMLQVKVANTALPVGSGSPFSIFSQPWPGPVGLLVE